MARRIYQYVTTPTPQLKLLGATTSTPVVPPPTGRPYPLVASLDIGPNTAGESIPQRYTRYLNYGYNGMVYYSLSAAGWSSDLAGIAAAHDSEPVNLQVTYKTHTAASLNAILDNLPDAWLPGFRYNYYQEPEDNLTTGAMQQAYKDTYTAAAATIRAHPRFATGKLQLPWIELQEFSLIRLYDNADPTRSPALFLPPDGDYGGILWSLFQFVEKYTDPTPKVQRIVRAMAEFAPNKPWALMAGNWTMHSDANGNFTASQLSIQADWLTQTFQQLKAAGCSGWAWYNTGDTGPNVAEARVENNPQALANLRAIAAAKYTTGV